jgi:hypothetical protein
MAKTYTKNTWTDEILAEAALHSITDPTGTPVPGNTTDIESVITALNALLDILSNGAKISLETDVVQAGTSLDATKMNNIENGIDTLDDLIDAIKSKINIDSTSELTISSGAITAVNGAHKLQPQTGTADDLDTINGLTAGDLIILYVSDAGTDTITFKHGTGNISCAGGADIELSTGAVAAYYNGTTVFICGGGGKELSYSLKFICNGRLTLESGVPVSTAEQSDKTTLYFTPYNGNCISIYDTSDLKWKIYEFTELSLALNSLTASRPHDIFAYINSGSPAIEALAWTDATTRAVSLTFKNGVLVKNTDNSRRYLGTIYVDAANKCQDTLTKAYVWNNQNQILRRMYMAETTSHTYNGAARLWNNSETNNRFDFVCGLTSTLSTIGYSRIKAGTDAYYGFTYIYYDGVNVGYLLGNYNVQTISAGAGIVQNAGAGYHYINIYEGGNDNNSTFINFFLYATMMR